MIVLGALVAAVVGVPAGLFANLVIDRVPEKQPLRPVPDLRSLSRGRRQAAVVAATVVLFAGTVLRFRADWVIPAYFVFFVCIVTVTVIDFDRQIIPNYIVYPTIFAALPLLALAALAGGEWGRFGHAVLGASLAWLAMLVIHIISPGGMGFGDVRLAFVLGLFLGWIGLSHVLVGLFLGLVLISVVGVALTILRLRSLQDHIAFGPFLAAGSTLAVFAGHALIHWWT